jgi:hypothetical protein
MEMDGAIHSRCLWRPALSFLSFLFLLVPVPVSPAEGERTLCCSHAILRTADGMYTGGYGMPYALQMRRTIQPNESETTTQTTQTRTRRTCKDTADPQRRARQRSKQEKQETRNKKRRGFAHAACVSSVNWLPWADRPRGDAWTMSSSGCGAAGAGSKCNL